MIDQLAQKFAPKKIVESQPASPSPPPCQCGHTQHWRAHHQTQWRCGRCNPPPAKSLVAEWAGVVGDSATEPPAPQSPQESLSPSRLTSETHVTFCKPWCEQCGGWRGIEREWSDGSHAIHCLTCRAELPEVPRERQAKEKNKNRELDSDAEIEDSAAA